MSVKIRAYTKSGKAAWEVDIRIRFPDGREHRERVKSPVSSRSGAKFWAEQRERELLKQSIAELTAEPKPIPTLSEFLPKFMSYSETNNKPSTVAAKQWALKSHLVPHFGNVPLDKISSPETEEFKAKQLKAGQSRKSVNNQLGVLRKLMNLAVEWGELPHAPRIRALRLPEREVRFLTFDEEARFLAAAPAEWRAMVHTALKTGLRLGELLALKWEDVDLVAGRLMVRRTLWRNTEGSPKGGRSREVPLGDDIIAALKAHRPVSLMKSEYVFCDAEGKRLNHKKVSKLVPRICKRAGLAKRLTMHDLRHTFASHLVMRGVTLKAVQELLGHASIDMTLRYAHLSPDVKRDAVKLLDAPKTEVLGEMLEKQSA